MCVCVCTNEAGEAGGRTLPTRYENLTSNLKCRGNTDKMPHRLKNPEWKTLLHMGSITEGPLGWLGKEWAFHEVTGERVGI